MITMRQFRFFIIAAAALCLACSSNAAGKWTAPRTVYYLTEQQQQFPGFKAPPAMNSKEELADLAVVRDWNRKRTEGQCAEARAQAQAEYEEFFGDLSPFPSPLPAGAAVVFRRVKAESDWIDLKLKDRFNRPRPFLREPGLKHCLESIDGPSYPSGHAVISRVYALILSDLVPQRRAEFLARADEAALYRVISGVHYPSDIEAGKKLADAIYAKLLKSRVFGADMSALKGYLSGSPALAAK
ncbi:MAG: phosphatase PAP2 family protein [Elusimicrobiales bacterium]|jgi:acid phosphatase (class A)